MQDSGEKVRIISEWKRSGRGVVEEAIAELLTTSTGRMLLYDCFQLFSEIESLDCDCNVGPQMNGFPIIYQVFDIRVDGMDWVMYFSIIREKACVLMLKPIIALDDLDAMERQCISRANIWSKHCERDCGNARPPISLSEYIDTRDGDNQKDTQ